MNSLYASNNVISITWIGTCNAPMNILLEIALEWMNLRFSK